MARITLAQTTLTVAATFATLMSLAAPAGADDKSSGELVQVSSMTMSTCGLGDFPADLPTCSPMIATSNGIGNLPS